MEAGSSPDRRVHFGQWLAALFLFLAGGLAQAMVSLLGGMNRILPLFQELGLSLPVLTQVVLGTNLPALCLVAGFGGAVAVVVLANRGLQTKAWTVALVGLIGLGLLDLLVMLAVIAPVSEVYRQIGYRRPAPVPGHAAQIAEEVEEELRRALARGVGSFRTPAGQEIRYLIYTGPGIDTPAPATLPPYEQARQHPGCLILPWGAPDRTDVSSEPYLFFPTGEEGGLDPSGIDDASNGPNAPPWLNDRSTWGMDEYGVPVPYWPGVLSAPGPEGADYSYALSVSRGRLDSYDGRSVNVRGSETTTRLTSEDAFSDALLNVSVAVFRDFDPDAPRDADFAVPLSNAAESSFEIQLVVPELP